MKADETGVICLRDVDSDQVGRLLRSLGLNLVRVEEGLPIPASFWGEPEAGIKQSDLFARGDTPLHSILHETCHFLCMNSERRETLDTDAGGDYDEENAVCYLQILLADSIGGFGKQRCMEDMDRWGYSFRLGSARAWYESDAEDARLWLQARRLIDPTTP